MTSSRWLCLVVACSAVGLPGADARSSIPNKRSDFTYLREAIASAVDGAQQEKAKSGFGVRASGACILGWFLNKGGDEGTWKFSLRGNKEYVFVAAGDSDVKSIELECWNKDSEKPLDAQKGVTPTSTIKVPGNQGNVLLTVKCKIIEAKDPVDFVVLVCLEKGSADEQIAELKSCGTRLVKDIEAFPGTKGLHLDGYGDICLYGALLAKSNTEAISNRIFRKGTEYLFLGQGDSNCGNMEMTLFKRDDAGGDGEKVGRDTSPRGPVAFMQIEGGKENWRGNLHVVINEFVNVTKPSLAITAILVKSN